MALPAKKMAAPTCQWCLEKEKKLFWCSRCKASSYCSVDCQRKHWKNGHREACKKHSENQAKADGVGDDFSSFVQVFKEWRDGFTSTLPFLLVQKLGAQYCFKVQPPSKIIKILLTYNSSTRLFKVEDISTVDLADMQSTTNEQQICSSIRQGFETHNRRHPSHPVGFAWVHCNEVAAVMPAILDKKLKKEFVSMASKNSTDVFIKVMENIRV